MFSLNRTGNGTNVLSQQNRKWHKCSLSTEQLFFFIEAILLFLELILLVLNFT